MSSFWPLMPLVVPFILTLTRARSAWLWLSLALGLAALWAILSFVTWDWARGGTGGPFAGLLTPTGPQRVYHDTYYVVAHLQYLGACLFLPTVIGALLWITNHPPYAKWDVMLFWAAAVLLIAINVTSRLYMGAEGMPRRYADYPDTFDTITALNLALVISFITVLLIAAARPIRSWWRARLLN